MYKNCSLVDIDYHLPENVVSNDELARQHPDWLVKQTEAKTGVFQRRVSLVNETSYDLALSAVRKLLNRHEKLIQKIDAILFCTQSPDHLIPSNAFLLHRDLHLGPNVLAFDYNLACSGYVIGLLLAKGLIVSGAANNILLINADTYSKLIDQEDRATVMLFGDGAAVSWISAESNLEVDPLLSSFDTFECATVGKGWDKFYIPSGGFRQSLPSNGDSSTQSTIYMDGLQVVNFVNHFVVPQLRKFMKNNNITNENLSQLFLHQGSALAIEMIKTKLAMDHQKVYSNIQNIGNTVSASLPILLKDFFTNHRLASDSDIIMCGFGAGFSSACVLCKT